TSGSLTSAVSLVASAAPGLGADHGGHRAARCPHSLMTRPPRSAGDQQGKEKPPMAEVLQDAAAMAGDLTGLRRAIHPEPEIGLDLPRTQAKVLAALDGLPLEITTGRSASSVTAVLRGSGPDRSVLLRGDMDALPVTETTGLPYASQVDGVMHACGHDLH